MKLLINKKTGKIISIKDLLTDEFIYDLFSKDFNYFITILYKIAEEWEDYEEPKFIKGIKSVGNIGSSVHIELGREEEAEKLVEKLNALKRLLNKGFKFGGFYYTQLRDYAKVNIEATMINDNINGDLELIFGEE